MYRRSYTVSLATEVEKRAHYFKFMNIKQCHRGYQYKDGLNILKQPFALKGDCVEGGFYFCDTLNLKHYVDFGTIVRQVTLPFNDPDLQMVCVDFGDGNKKWRANKIILGQTWSVLQPDDPTVKSFNLFPNKKWHVLRIAIEEDRGNLHGLRPFFMKWKYDEDCYYRLEDCLLLAVKCGNIPALELLSPMIQTMPPDQPTTPHKTSQDLIYQMVLEAVLHDQVDIAAMLIDMGGPLGKGATPAIRDATGILCVRGEQHLLARMIQHHGLDIHADSEYLLSGCVRSGLMNMVRHLIDHYGCDPSIHDWNLISYAKHYGQSEIAEFLENLKNKTTTTPPPLPSSSS